MIARIWAGAVRRGDADVYAGYIRDTGFDGDARTAGNRGAWLLGRAEDDRTEFLAVSVWDSFAAIRAFAGDDIDAAVLHPQDQQHLLGGESSVTHYQVVDHREPDAGAV